MTSNPAQTNLRQDSSRDLQQIWGVYLIDLRTRVIHKSTPTKIVKRGRRTREQWPHYPPMLLPNK